MSTSPTPAQTSSKRRLKKWLLILGILATSLAWGLFLRGQLAKLREFEWQLFSWQNGLGILLGGTYFAGLSFIWVMLVRQMLGMERPLPYRSGMSLWLSTMITRYIPGNIWHIVGRLAGANQFGIPKTVIISSSTIEQVLTLVGSLGLGLLALPLWLSSEGITRGVSIVLLYIFLLPACLSALHPKVLGRFLSWLSVRIRRPEVKWNYQYGQILGMSGLYFLTSAVAGLALGAVLWGIEGIHMRDLPMVLGCASLAWAAGYLSFFTPSGLGVREAILTALLAQSYSLSGSVMASLLFRLVCTLGEVLALVVFLSLDFPALKNWFSGNKRDTSPLRL